MAMPKRVFIILALVLIGLLTGIMPVLAQGEGEELTETFVTSDGTLSLKYPAGWGIGAPNLPDLIMFSNNPDRLEADNDEPFPAGSVLVYIFGPQSASMVFREGLPASLDEALDQMVQMAAASEDDETAMPELSEPEALTLAGYPAVRIGVTTPDAEGSIVIMDFDGGFAIVSITAVPGELSLFEETVMAVLDTLSYAAPNEPQTFNVESGALTLQYPPGWIALGTEMIAIASSYETIQLRDTEPVTPGSVLMMVFPPDLLSEMFVGAKNTTEVATLLADHLVPDTEGKTVSEAVPVMVGAREGVRVDFTTANDQGYALALDFDEQIVGVLVRVAVGELADQEEVVLSILESIQYTPVEETTTP